MRPSELKKASSARLDIILSAISLLERAMYNMPGISRSDRRTLELWRGQVIKAKDLQSWRVEYGK